jgi:hypothetical protein
VVLLDGRPERLWIEREGESAGPRLGERHRARVGPISSGLGLAKLELAGGAEAALSLPKAKLHQGASVEVEIVSERRADKPALARFLGLATGDPLRLDQAPSLESRLRAAAPEAEIIGGQAAREAADEAEDAVLSIRHELAGDIVIHIEPTRALTAVDIDWQSALRRSAAGLLRANQEALAETARLLRLKSIGGAVVVDLIGFPRERDAIRAAAKAAFEPDAPGVVVLPPNHLGLLQLAKPHREQPLSERLCAPDGRLSARSVAQRLARALEREGQADPGGRFIAECAPEAARALGPLVQAMGPRFQVREALGWDRLKTDIRSP